MKRRISNFYTFLRVRLFHFLVRRHFIHGIILVIAMVVVLNNLQAQDIRDENFGDQTVVLALFPSEEFGEPDQLPMDIGATPDLSGLGTMTMGNTAITKPQIMQTESTMLSSGKITKYVVKSGETISSISKKFNISVDTILWQNKLKPTSTIKPGAVLEILPETGVTHQVKWGETLGGIAGKYKVDTNKILASNGLIDPTALRAGQTLIIPNGKLASYYSIKTYTAAAPVASVSKLFTAGKVTGTGNMLWPAPSRVITQYFTWRHHGLDIGLPKGQPIYAADDGTIIKSQCGWNGGYGCYMIIDHGNGIKTLYGHASKLNVSVGDAVTRGQTIGLVGSTGKSTGSHIHLEVRVNGKAVNPLGYIK
ncbi:MAG: LysM peptidoglycan-binding domain-containing M23 family metallopeptidase [Candidatus Falkowbacteria bacterium]